MTKSSIWSGVGGFVVKLISLYPISWSCLIWLNMNLFSWRLVLIMFLSLRDVMTCTLLYFYFNIWLEMASKTCWNVFGTFMLILSIQSLVLFLSGNTWSHGLLFSDWEIYDMLWCSQYCVLMPMEVHLSGNFTLTSDISYLIKGWSEMSIFNFGRVELFAPTIISEPGDHPLTNLLLCS